MCTNMFNYNIVMSEQAGKTHMSTNNWVQSFIEPYGDIKDNEILICMMQDTYNILSARHILNGKVACQICYM